MARRGKVRQGMNYEQYIASSIWRKKRKERLEMDGHRCRLCDEDGTVHRLEVHHRPSSYAKIPNETAKDDLVTVCARCHDVITNIIRSDRYIKRNYDIPPIEARTVERKDINSYGVAGSAVQADINLSSYRPQWANSRPNEQVDKINQTDIEQARKNRRGFRGNG